MSEHMDSTSTIPETELPMPTTQNSTATTYIFYAGISESEPVTFTPLHTMSEPEPIPDISDPISAVPLAALCPPSLHSNAPQFASIHEEYIAEQEGLRRMAEKVEEAQQKKRAAKGTKGTKSKVVDREGQRGTWYPCKIEEDPLKLLVDEGFLKQDMITFTEGQVTPTPPDGYTVLCRAWIERGLSLPPSKFFLDVLELYKLQPHNICPNSFVILSNFQTLHEGYLGVEPDIRLFQWYFQCRALYEPKQPDSEETKICNCGSVSFVLRAGRKYPTFPPIDSVRYWNRNWFYYKNLTSEDQRQPNGLPEFKDGAAVAQDSWKSSVSIDEHQDLLMMARRISKLVDDGLRGCDVIHSWFTCRIQPLSLRPKLICRYTGTKDPLRISEQSLPADSLIRRAKQLWKLPKDFKDFSIAVDIYTADNECPLVSNHFQLSVMSLSSTYIVCY